MAWRTNRDTRKKFPLNERKGVSSNSNVENAARKGILKAGEQDKSQDLGHYYDPATKEKMTFRLADHRITRVDPDAFPNLPVRRVSMDASERTLFEIVQNPTHWKEPTVPIKVGTLPEALKMQEAIIFFVGGAEITETKNGFVVTSKGYYGYGA